MSDEDEAYCDHAGHDWQEAGGGLEICSICEEERWQDENEDN